MATSLAQQALANDYRFRLRLQGCLAAIAFQVLGEDPATAGHAARAAYARLVAGNVVSYAALLAPALVMRTNLVTANTSYDFVQGAVITDATDAAIQSQIFTDWNSFAGA